MPFTVTVKDATGRVLQGIEGERDAREQLIEQALGRVTDTIVKGKSLGLIDDLVQPLTISWGDAETPET